MPGSDVSASRPAHETKAKPASQTSAPNVETIDATLECSRATETRLICSRIHEASCLQMRCGMSMEALRARINPTMPPGLGVPDSSRDPLSRTHDRAVLLAGLLDPGSKIFKDCLRNMGSRLDPHEHDSWKALSIARWKAELLSCAYVFLRGMGPPFNTFTPDLRHIEPESKLCKYLEADGIFKKAEDLATYAELGMWISAYWLPMSTSFPDNLPQKQQLHAWDMPESDADALGASLSSLALELISLVVDNVMNTPDPPKALFDTFNAAQDSAAGASDTPSSGSNKSSLRSRLAKKAEQQQLQRAEAEWLQKTRHIQASQTMRWRDLLVVLTNLTGFFKPEGASPGTLWRLVVSAHVAACVCRLLGLVFVWGENRVPTECHEQAPGSLRARLTDAGPEGPRSCSTLCCC